MKNYFHLTLSSFFSAIPLILLGCFFTAMLFAPTHHAEAQLAVFDLTTEQATFSLQLKEFVLDGVAKLLAKIVVRELVSETVNWIRGGGEKGSPLFVGNWERFLAKAGDQAAAAFLYNYAGLNVCAPFNLQVRLGLFNLPAKRQVSCTLSQGIRNVQAFYNNFSGGWQSWLVASQPQNNIEGAYLATFGLMAYAGEQRKNATHAELQANAGFIGIKKCVKRATIEASAPGAEAEEFVNPEDFQGVEPPCEKSITITPGQAIHDQFASVAGSDIADLVGADEINEIIVAIIDTLVHKMITGDSKGFGLAGTGGPDSGFSYTALSPTFIDSLNNQKQKVVTNSGEIFQNENDLLAAKKGLLSALDHYISTLGETRACEVKIIASALSSPEQITAAQQSISSIDNTMSKTIQQRSTADQSVADLQTILDQLASIQDQSLTGANAEEQLGILSNITQQSAANSQDTKAKINTTNADKANVQLSQSLADESLAQCQALINSQAGP